MASNIVFTAEKTEIGERESFSIRRTGWDTWDASLPWDSLSDCIMTLTNAFAAAQGTTTRGITYQVRNVAGNYRPMSKLQWLDTDGQEYILSIHYDELPLLASALSDLADFEGLPLDLDVSHMTWRNFVGNTYRALYSQDPNGPSSIIEKAVTSTVDTMKGADSGIASLDGDGKLPETQVPDRLSEAELTATFAPLTFMVDSFAQEGDASDDQAWARAVSAARSFAKACVIQGGARRYDFAAPVNCYDLKNATIRGWGGKRTVLGSAVGALASLFNVPTTSGGTVENLTFEDFHVDGGMVPMGPGFARDTRTFGANNLLIPVYVNGNKAPTGGAWSEVIGVTFRRVSVFGCVDLPLLVRGASEVVIDDCDFERTMDPGVIFSEGVTLRGSRSRWSADNGFSISRGNRDVTITGNRVFGAARWGLWVAGWGTNAGPSDITVTGNQIRMCAYGGISLHWGTCNATVTGNTITDIRRGQGGGANGDALGVGIQIYGGTQDGGMDGVTWAENVTVTGNTLIDCQRGAVLVRAQARNVVVEANNIVRPGTLNNWDGTPISSSNTLENFGISVVSVGTEVADGKWGPVTVKNNAVIDDRATPVMNYGVFASTNLSALVERSGNRVFGARNAATEDNILILDGASATPRSIEWRTDGARRAGLLMSDATGVRFLSYTDAGTENEVARIDRSAHTFTFLRPAKLASYASGARPAASTFTGSVIFDSTLGKVVLSNGTAWVNMDGTPL